MSKFASLTAGLLARKGEAEPSATPYADQLLTRVGAPAVDLRPMIQNVPQRPKPVHFVPPVFGRRTPQDHDHHDHAHHDDAPHELTDIPPPPQPLEAPAVMAATPAPMQVSPAPILTSVAAPKLVHSADENYHEVMVPEPRCGTCPGPSAEEANKSYHVNLRMKRMRFVRLKLTAALMRKPVQEIVNEALDAWFETVPSDVLGDCACLNARSD
jgi:hypothetical protein